MGRTHDVTISGFDLDRLESQLSAAEEEIEELKTQLGDAKITADLWTAHAKMADESAADLKAELVNVKHHWKEELTAERALADRLAEAANAVIDQWETPNWKLTEPTATYMHVLRNTLTAWKEARSE